MHAQNFASPLKSVAPDYLVWLLLSVSLAQILMASTLVFVHQTTSGSDAVLYQIQFFLLAPQLYVK